MGFKYVSQTCPASLSTLPQLAGIGSKIDVLILNNIKLELRDGNDEFFWIIFFFWSSQTTEFHKQWLIRRLLMSTPRQNCLKNFKNFPPTRFCKNLKNGVKFETPPKVDKSYVKRKLMTSAFWLTWSQGHSRSPKIKKLPIKGHKGQISILIKSSQIIDEKEAVLIKMRRMSYFLFISVVLELWKKISSKEKIVNLISVLRHP